MIEFKNCPVIDGKPFLSIEEAQQSGIQNILAEYRGDAANDTSTWTDESAAEAIIQNRERVLDILTTTPTSRPRARKINGGRKPRKASAAAVNAAIQDMDQ